MKENIVDRLTTNIRKISAGGDTTSDFIENLNEDYNLDIKDCYINLIKMCDIGIEKVQMLNKSSSEKHALTLKQVKFNIFKLINIELNTVEYYNKFSSLFTEVFFAKMDACADFIRDNIEELSDESRISELLQETQNLIEEIKASTINTDLKKMLLLQLSGVYDSLIKYDLFGYDAVELSVKMTIGSIVMNLNKDADDEDKAYFAKSLQLMSKFNTVFSFVKNVTYLAGACTLLLPHIH